MTSIFLKFKMDLLNKVFRLTSMKFVSLSSFLLLLMGCDTNQQSNQVAKPLGNNKPNIVFIFSDDLSYKDISAYGQRNYKTPNLDELLSNSTRFTQAYTGAPECAPSRATMLTGLHVGHAPIRLNSSARGFEPLPDNTYTFGKMLQEAGYTTGVIGKWGLGYKDTAGNPLNQGFNYHYGYLTHYEAHSYFPLNLYENNKEIEFPQNESLNMQLLYELERNPESLKNVQFYKENGELALMDMKTAAYTPDLIDTKVSEFIEREKDNPFFLFFTTNLPHGPVIVDDLRQLKNRDDMSLLSKSWGAMVQRLDISVGKLIKKLKAEGLYDNTMIIFASDNGYAMHNSYRSENGESIWPDDEFLNNKGPFHGGKFSALEGGMRVPFSIHMPQQDYAEIISEPVWLLDLFPTFKDVSGYQGNLDVDGFSLLPLLEGDRNSIPKDRLMYFYKQNQQAARKGGFYAYRDHPEQPVQLFLLEEDQRAQVNLANIYPKIAADFKEILDTIHQPSQWYWNPGDTPQNFKKKQHLAEETDQIIKRYRPNNMKLMPWERNKTN
ncbi:sulfatase-like hydrolase/transferase [Leeuwenhoekiella parthenopeia]|uniref:Sulfatase-like hydrolase/transferase n=1 Tax=Leeuwenhoekiella parthenopeia TaxID=2890320 RepID=A0ABS8GMZ0_9FLAO|nr:sulfatase-like hydrolase/transferase [Leeuwenhoekiella parthenopeia]MCC4211280.1 sulfatase-like hydrolase/transferase [Leeuwenhoekiella parthenopeia]